MATSRPRLVYYTSGLWPCGVASYQRNLAAALAEHADVTSVRLPTDRVPGDHLRAILRRRKLYRQLAALSARADAVLIDYTATFWNGSRLGENLFPAFARNLKAPAIVILHEGPGRTDPADTTGPLPLRAAKRFAHRTLAAWDTGTWRYEPFVRTGLFRFATHLVTHAETLADVSPGRVRALPAPAYPLPAPAWSPREVDERFGLAGKRVVLLLGFPQPSKGFDRAVACLPHLPADVVLVQAGDSEQSRPEAEKLAAQAAALGAGERFVRTGYLADPELAAVLRRADVALAPFRAVHQSSSLGHLIAAGVPIVASRIPTTERLAADGAGLRFADCDSPASLAATVAELLNDPAARADLHRKNEDYARRHGFDAVARFLLGLIAPRRGPIDRPVTAGVGP